MRINTATDLAKLALVGGVAYVGFRALQSLGNVPTPGEATQDFATNAYWRTGPGVITGYGLDWITNGWGDGWDYEPFTSDEAAAAGEAAGSVNDRVGYDGWGVF